MPDIVEFDVSPELIQTSLRSLGEQLVLREQGNGNLQRVKVTKKRSNQPMDQAIEALFFTTLGTFPLVELELNFENRDVALSCQRVATTIQGSRGGLKKLKLGRMTLTGNTESLILALRDHPCLLDIEFNGTHTLIGFPHDELIRCLGTCPCLEIATFDFRQEMANTLGPALSGLFSKPSLKVLCLGNTFGPALVSQVCQGLHRNTNLKEIFLPVGNHGDTTTTNTNNTLHSIGEALMENTVLSTLNLLVTPIGTTLSVDGPVTNALKSHNRTLQGLWLFSIERKPWSPATIQSLEGMIEENSVLLKVNFCCNCNGLWVESPQQSTKIPFYLKLNKIGRRRFLEERPTQKEWADVIISNQEDIPVVFYFLSLNPSLLKGQGSPIGLQDPAEELLGQLDISEN